MKPQNLTIKIDNFANYAMINAPEVAAAEILEQIAEALRNGTRDLCERSEAALKDYNGNRVGRLTINEPQPQPIGELLAAVCNLILDEDATTRGITEAEILSETLRLIHFGQCWQSMKDKAEEMAGIDRPAAQLLERMFSIEKEISGDE